jgi:serine/threonine protein kinase
MSSAAERLLGPWRLDEELGRGGNAVVWRAVHIEDGTEVALKVLKSRKATTEPYRRFVREVEFLRSLDDFAGVLPIIDAHLTEGESRGERPWLAMPVARGLARATMGQPLETIVEAVWAIAGTLAELADRFNVGHRDIKPGNLYELDGRWLVGDFGLIDVPALDDLTRSDRPMGPANFMAYEMISNPATADSKPADVYSLGKTLWCLATEIDTPPLGQQPLTSSGFRVYDLRPHPGARELDGLIDRMSRLDPASRPTMREVQTELETWRAPRAQRAPIDVAELGARFRATRSSELAAREQSEQQREQALEAVRELQQRSTVLNDALRQVDDHAAIDAMGVELIQNILGSRHSHHGRTTVFQWVRCSSILSGNPAWRHVLHMGRCVELLDDGTLLARWMLFVGPERSAGSNFHQQEGYEAPVGSIELSRMLDKFVSDLAERLPLALATFVDGASSAS